jgi:hypothetical protein
MKNKISVVIDTNVVVSAVLLPHTLSRQVFDFVVLRGELLVSEGSLAELNEVLVRPKFRKYVSEKRRLEFFSALVRVAKIITVVDVISECRDEKDNKFLELAVSGQATHIITGDNDLLVLNPFRRIEIVSPAVFLNECISG